MALHSTSNVSSWNCHRIERIRSRPTGVTSGFYSVVSISIFHQAGQQVHNGGYVYFASVLWYCVPSPINPAVENAWSCHCPSSRRFARRRPMDEHCKKPLLVFYQFLKKCLQRHKSCLFENSCGMFKEDFSPTTTSIHRLQPVIPLLITPNLINSLYWSF